MVNTLIAKIYPHSKPTQCAHGCMAGGVIGTI